MPVGSTTETSIRVGLAGGTAVQRAQGKLSALEQKYKLALSHMRRHAELAGRLLAEAAAADAAAKASATPAQQATLVAQRQILANKAYRARVGAEAEKYRAAFSIFAKNARQTEANLTRAAQASQDSRRRQTLIEDAARVGGRADALEQAADAAAAAVDSVPEPWVVSKRRADQVAVYAGPTGDEVEIGMPMPGWQVPGNMVSPVMRDFYPADIVRAAASFGSVGLGAVDPYATEPGTESWLDAVKRALGIGAAAAGSAAMAEGQAIAEKDKAAGAAVSAGGGVLQALASILGISQDRGFHRGEQEQQGDSPWWIVAVVGLVAVGGYAIWRATR